MAKIKTKPQPQSVPSVSIDELTVPEDVRSKVKSTALTVVEQANQLTITNDGEYQAAGEFLTTVVKPGLQQIDDAFNPIVRRWHEGHKETLATKKRLALPFEQAEGTIKRLMGSYHLEKQRRLREEQRQLQESLKAQAEQSTIDRAAELAGEGRNDEALELLERIEQGTVEPVTALPPVKYTPTRAEGTSIRMLKQFEIIDESRIKRAYLQPNEQAIRAIVTALGGKAVNEVGEGSIRVFEVPSVGARGR